MTVGIWPSNGRCDAYRCGLGGAQRRNCARRSGHKRIQGAPKSKQPSFWCRICRTVGPTSNQTIWANEQTSSPRSKQTVKTSKQISKQKEKKEKETEKEKEKDKEKDKENEKEKEMEMEVWFNRFAAVCPGGAGGFLMKHHSP